MADLANKGFNADNVKVLRERASRYNSPDKNARGDDFETVVPLIQKIYLRRGRRRQKG